MELRKIQTHGITVAQAVVESETQSQNQNRINSTRCFSTIIFSLSLSNRLMFCRYDECLSTCLSRDLSVQSNKTYLQNRLPR